MISKVLVLILNHRQCYPFIICVTFTKTSLLPVQFLVQVLTVEKMYLHDFALPVYTIPLLQLKCVFRRSRSLTPQGSLGLTLLGVHLEKENEELEMLHNLALLSLLQRLCLGL